MIYVWKFHLMLFVFLVWWPISAILPAVVSGQSKLNRQDDPLENTIKQLAFVDDTTKGVIVINNPGLLLEKLLELPFFRQRTFERFLAVISDGNFALVAKDELTLINERMHRFLVELKKIDSIVVLAKSLEATDQQLAVLLILKVEVENAPFGSADLTIRVLDRIANAASLIAQEIARPQKTPLSNADPFAKMETNEESEFNNPDVIHNLLGFEHENGEVQAVNGIGGMTESIGDRPGFLWANNRFYYEQLIESISKGVDPKSQLVERRLFKRVVSSLKNRQSRSSTIFMYVDTHDLESYYEPGSWEVKKIPESMPALGAKLILGNDEDGQLAVFFDSAIVKTVPTVGLAMRIESLRPIESIPPLAVEPLRYEGWTYDPQEYWRARESAYDAVYGSGALREKIMSQFKHPDDERDYFSDVLPATSGYYFGFYKTPFKSEELLSIYSVADFEAQKRVIEGSVRLANLNQPWKLTEQALDDLIVWVRSDSAQRIFLTEENRIFEREPNQVTDLDVTKRDGFALSKKWGCQGNLADMVSQIRLLEDDDGIDFAEPVREMQTSIKSYFNCGTDPIQFWYVANGRRWGHLIEGDIYRVLDSPQRRREYCDQITGEVVEDFDLLPRNKTETVLIGRFLLAQAITKGFGKRLFLMTNEGTHFRYFGKIEFSSE